MADIQIGYLRSAFDWWQLRDEQFVSPVVRGMAGSHGKAGSRILTAEEIIDLWRALDEIEHVPPAFPAFVRVLFLTACRRNEVARMHTDELERGNQFAMIGGASTKAATSWTIPGSRYKTKVDHVVPLIPAIKKFLPECKDGFVFSSDGGKRPINGFDPPKKQLDAAIARIRKREKRPAMPAWCFHDLRRTSRSVMAAAGVLEDVSERVLGHKMAGVRGVYNRHGYFNEKADALSRLASFIDGIVHPKENVVPMKRAGRAAASDKA
jgi:integrase